MLCLMEYSVIVPVYNRREQIADCVRAVLACDFPRDRFELLVVDNGSTDGSAKAAEEAGARVLREARPNRCAARNRGANEAAGRWLVFTDSDCLPEAGWLEALDRAVAALPPGSPVAGLGGRIASAPPQNPVEAYAELRGILDQAKFLEPGRLNSPPFAATANLAVRRSAFLEAGGFDPESQWGEDADLCWRLAEAGGTLQYVPEAAVIHCHRATPRELWRQTRGYGRAHAWQFRRWRSKWGRRVWFEPRHYMWALKGLLKSPWCWLSGHTPLQRRMGWYDAIANLGLIAGRIEGSIRERVIVL